MMIRLLIVAAVVLSFAEVADSFSSPSQVWKRRPGFVRRVSGSSSPKRLSRRTYCRHCSKSSPTTTSTENNHDTADKADYHTWSPQDLTADNDEYLPLPPNDYIKLYQEHPTLWPVEIFVIAYRRIITTPERKRITQVLVRPSANGTSKWGVGTGVPVTRWTDPTKPLPTGYTWSTPKLFFEARHFPEFPKGVPSWTLQKVDICKDAFKGSHVPVEWKDPELEEYAAQIRNHLRDELRARRSAHNVKSSSWNFITLSVVQDILENDNSLAAIQGSLRMSGLFAQVENGSSGRYIQLDTNAPDPAELAKSMRIYTMFPQMPDPMPLPTASPKELHHELITREKRMKTSGRNPHRDVHGRIFTHKSTSNVSNTIHGVYLTVDVTDRPALDDGVPAVDLFGTRKVKREWVSLGDLKVLEQDEETISQEDTKPTFISGFIVRELVKDGIINIHG